MPSGVRNKNGKDDTVLHRSDYESSENNEFATDSVQDARVHRKRFVSVRKKRQRKILLIVSSVLLVIIATILLLISPVFAIEEFEIQKLQFYSESEIISALKEVEGKNGLISVFKNTSFDDADGLLDLRLPDLEKKLIFNCPYIENATVSFSFPNKLVVKATERKPVFLTDYHNTYLHIDSKGFVLEAFSAAERPDYPIVKGLEISGYKIGCSIAETDNEKIHAVIKLCNTLSSMGIFENNIDIIDVTDYNDIWMFCAPALSIKFGGTDGFERKVSKLKGIFDAGYDGNTAGVLDLYSGKNPVLKPAIDKETAPGDAPAEEE